MKPFISPERWKCKGDVRNQGKFWGVGALGRFRGRVIGLMGHIGPISPIVLPCGALIPAGRRFYLLLGLCGQLRVVEAGVGGAFGEEFCVGASLDDSAIFDDENLVSSLDGR